MQVPEFQEHSDRTTKVTELRKHLEGLEHDPHKEGYVRKKG
jgi:hypothetical protein